jgi:hypothetical protein
MDNQIISKKKTIIIALAVLLVIAGASAFWYQRRQEQRRQEVIRQEAERLRKQQAEEQLQKEVSVGYATVSQAVKDKNPDVCLKLEGEVKDSCFYAVAQSVSDKAICGRIADEKKKNVCQEFLDFRAGKNITKEFCSAFKVPEVAESCYSQVFSKFTDTKSCEGFPEPHKQRCLDLVNTGLAVKGDGSGCDSVVDKDMKSSCRMASASAPKDADKDGLSDTLEIGYGLDPFKADTDGDGLNDSEEIEKYRTNPKKADTDGDGHTDGEEVKGGFNPLGEGKLK